MQKVCKRSGAVMVKIPDKLQETLDLFRHGDKLTNRAVSLRLGIGVACASARMKRLCDLRLVESCRCGKECLYWVKGSDDD